jgi:hypothetical protein
MINYQKRKNCNLFQSLEKPNTLFLSKMQNYIPIYNRFFGLNETTGKIYNNIKPIQKPKQNRNPNLNPNPNRSGNLVFSTIINDDPYNPINL